MSYQIYRNTTAGMSLQETLDELICHNQITPSLAFKVLAEFDKSISKTIHETPTRPIRFKGGRLVNYRFCDNVWTLELEDVEFRHCTPFATADKVKVVACEARKQNQDAQ